MSEDIYIGRIVLVGRTESGTLCAAYRVSSRSFPNRTAVVRDRAVSIVPKPGHESDIHKNPYIAYNCARVTADGQCAIVTNGGQTDPIAEKMNAGMNARDALALVSLTLDYEKDDYNTPRISAVIDTRNDSAWLAVIRRDGLGVREARLDAGRFAYVATYEENRLDDAQTGDFGAATASDACGFIVNGGIFAYRTNAVTAVAALATPGGISLAAMDV